MHDTLKAPHLSEERLKEAVARIEDVLIASLDWNVLISVLADEVLQAGIFRSLTITLVNWEDGYVEIVGNYLAVDRQGKINPNLSGADELVYVDESDKREPFVGRLAGRRISLDQSDDLTVIAALRGNVLVQGFVEHIADSRYVKMAYFIPLRCGGRVAAVLSTGSQPDDQDEIVRRIQIMQPLFKQVALALEHARIHRALEHRLRALEQRDRLVSALQKVERSLLSSLNRDEILDRLVQEIASAGIFESLSVALVDRDAHRVDVVRRVVCRFEDGQSSVYNASKSVVSYDLDDTNITAEVARNGTMAVLDEWDPRFDKRVDSPADRHGRTAYFIPIKKGDVTVAVLATGSPMAEKEEVLERLKALNPLFDMLALALVHATLYQNLSEQSQRLEIVQESIGNGVVTTDRAGYITMSNTPFSALFGATADGVVGRYLGAVLSVDEGGQGLVDQLIDSVLAVGRRESIEITLLGGGGTPSAVRIYGTPIGGDEGWVDGGVFVAQDITAERAREMERLRIERIESLGQLADGIAHDFNNMLSSATINTSLLKMVTDDKKRGEIVDDIDKALYAARDLTRQLMGFMHNEELVRKRASLQDIVRNSATFALRGSNAKLEIEEKDDLWPVDIDASQIRSVVHNLILNAQQAMPGGGTVRVEMRNFECEDGQSHLLQRGSYVLCSVRDEGMGIRADDLQRVFDPYFTTKKDGAGLGLASSYAIINRHGGMLTADSAVGEGSEFRFYLPRGARVSETQIESVSHSAMGGRVLLLDDDDQLCEAVMRLSEDLGYDLLATPFEEEALMRYRSAWCDRNPFDVVILDLTIPGGRGGIAMAKEIQQINPQARIVLSSGYSKKLDMANVHALGFVACLTKPYTVDEFRSVVERALPPG